MQNSAILQPGNHFSKDGRLFLVEAIGTRNEGAEWVDYVRFSSGGKVFERSMEYMGELELFSESKIC